MAGAAWLLAAYLGAAHTQRAALQFSRPPIAFTSMTFRGESFRPPLYYGCRAAYFPRRSRFGVEGEFTHLKVYANLPPGGPVQRFSMSHGLNLVLANVVVRAALHDSARGPLRLAARAGAGLTVPHVESTMGGVSREGYQLGSMAAHVAAGIELPVTPHVSAIAEYKLTRTREHVEIAAGDARGLFQSHHAIFGLAWRTR